MPAKLYAVIDTNVVVSALLARDPKSNTKRILDLVLDGTICPLFCDEIITEYQEVLSRDKFPFKPDNIHDMIASVEHFGYDPAWFKSKIVCYDNKVRLLSLSKHPII